jgi:toxin-antitoxin system PIN domain toxin
MSYAIDVNILLYASDKTCAQHERARSFIASCAERREVFCLAWITVFSYLRMATHPVIFSQPLAPREAEQNITSLIDLPHCRLIGEEDGFWSLYREVAAAVPARANLVPDAHLATILRQHGVKTLVTHDRDFRKFDFLTVVDPVQ